MSPAADSLSRFAAPAAPHAGRTQSYGLYGLQVESSIPLPAPEVRRCGEPDVSLYSASESFFAERCPSQRSPSSDWFSHAILPDGSRYVRWTELFEFLIAPDGRRIVCHSLAGASLTAFQTYLVSQVLSFALLQQGLEPLHATVVVVHDTAIAFMGHSGTGKSTLAGIFLHAGYRLLTDDVLVIGRRDGNGSWLAYPGPPRVKLFPDIAQVLLPQGLRGAPMHPQTKKLVLPLPAESAVTSPVPVQAIYRLEKARPGSDTVRIHKLEKRDACLALLEHTFNTIESGPSRLRQHFNFAASVAKGLPVKSLLYPRELSGRRALLDAILADMAQ